MFNKITYLSEAALRRSQAWAAMRSQAAVPVALAWCSLAAACLERGEAGAGEAWSVPAGVLHSHEASHPPTCSIVRTEDTVSNDRVTGEQ